MTLSQTARLVSDGPDQAADKISNWLTRLQSTLHRIGATRAARRRLSRDAQQLYAFSDRELWDLGLGRSDLPSIIAGTYHRD